MKMVEQLGPVLLMLLFALGSFSHDVAGNAGKSKLLAAIPGWVRTTDGPTVRA